VTPEFQTAVGGGIAALLLAIARYIRQAARALEQRNLQLAEVASDREKDRKDLNEAWAQIRELKGAVAVLTPKRDTP
jgi:predicted TIM-barrel fold metal-dependent hydrolase